MIWFSQSEWMEIFVVSRFLISHICPYEAYNQHFYFNIMVRQFAFIVLTAKSKPESTWYHVASKSAVSLRKIES